MSGGAHSGPVILDERTGKPYRQCEFARRFREVAWAAGVPDTIWNMDARAGAVTDAYEKGAREVDAMDLGTHTQACDQPPLFAQPAWPRRAASRCSDLGRERTRKRGA